MTSRIVDGRVVPSTVSGDIGLELCNTRAGWGSAAAHEYLVDHRALTIWARELGLLTPTEADRNLQLAAAAPRRAAAALTRTLQLRESLYAALSGRDEAALEAVRDAVALAVRRSRYRAATVGFPTRPGGTLQLDGGTGLTAVADRAALAAHRLLERYGADDIGRCPGDGCGWLFLDASHRRRWCTMAICGNRAKARRFAARHRTVPGA